MACRASRASGRAPIGSHSRWPKCTARFRRSWDSSNARAPSCRSSPHTTRRSMMSSSRSRGASCAMNEHPLYQLTLARMREFDREPEAIFWVFGFPIVLAFALGLAFRNSGPGELKVGVAVGPGDSALAAVLDGSPALAARVLDPADARA